MLHGLITDGSQFSPCLFFMSVILQLSEKWEGHALYFLWVWISQHLSLLTFSFLLTWLSCCCCLFVFCCCFFILKSSWDGLCWGHKSPRHHGTFCGRCYVVPLHVPSLHSPLSSLQPTSSTHTLCFSWLSPARGLSVVPKMHLSLPRVVRSLTGLIFPGKSSIILNNG